jgi:formylglycine-generating enzyme required for sulfatase activity
MQLGRFFVLSLILASVGCGARSELELPSTAGTEATGGSSVTDCPRTPGPIECRPLVCPSTTAGPTMIALPLGYCIDSTEVTERQYQAWLNTKPSTADQPAVCSWNLDFTPSGNWPPADNFLYDEFDQPVTYVDWCDAYAYCRGVGRRLCGRIDAGSNNIDQSGNPALSQWYAACTSNVTYGFPYGGTYDPTACNGADNVDRPGNGVSQTIVVGSMPGCRSPVAGYAGVYDLSGNVREWEDSCGDTMDATDICLLRGGSFDDSRLDLTCVQYAFVSRSNQDGRTGFRCCAP